MQGLRVGDGLAVKLPEQMVRDLKREEGDEVEVSIQSRPTPASVSGAEHALVGIRRLPGRLSPAGVLTRDERHER